ncbi:hypothetical protein [Pandoravirus japonicus]|uniref:Uncharacterized protein n=1 Tax=Pandoravirus japonicus TaxID=2823154 RepID=A0A811BRW3_9VIRU|nr:hypothetical protein [Pandoravirus japonicus]
MYVALSRALAFFFNHTDGRAVVVGATLLFFVSCTPVGTSVPSLSFFGLVGCSARGHQPVILDWPAALFSTNGRLTATLVGAGGNRTARQ